MLLPHHYVVVFQLLQSFLGKFQTAWQLIRNNTQSERTESLGLRNHAPEQIAQHVLAHKLLVVAHGNELDGMSMNSGLIVGTFLDKTGMNRQMAWQLGCRHHGIVGNDFVAGTIVQNKNDRTIVHRPTSQVAHSLACSLAEEVTTLQRRQDSTYLLHFADGRQRLHLVINKVGHINRNIATITLSPTILPKIASYLGNLIHFLL